MRKIFFLCSLMAVSFGYSQSFPIDFEDPLDANMIGANSGVFNVIADPDTPGENVGEFTNCCEDFSNMQIDEKQEEKGEVFYKHIKRLYLIAEK